MNHTDNVNTNISINNFRCDAGGGILSAQPETVVKTCNPQSYIFSKKPF